MVSIGPSVLRRFSVGTTLAAVCSAPTVMVSQIAPEHGSWHLLLNTLVIANGLGLLAERFLRLNLINRLQYSLSKKLSDFP